MLDRVPNIPVSVYQWNQSLSAKITDQEKKDKLVPFFFYVKAFLKAY